MNREPWQKISALIAAAFGVLCLFGGVILLSTEPGPGEVSVIIQGARGVIALSLSGICVAMGLWFWFWHLRWVRVLGLLCVAVVLLWNLWIFGSRTLQERAHERDLTTAKQEAELIGAGYLDQLIADPPETAYQARLLFEAFDADHRAVPAPSGSPLFQGRQFRAVWFLYYWTFFDPAFEGYTTFYPRDEDCALFLEAFGAQYDEIAPVRVFVELCEAP